MGFSLGGLFGSLPGLGGGTGSSSGVTGFSGGGAFNSTSTPVTATSDATINTVDNRAGGDASVYGGNVSLNPGDIQGTVNVSTTDQGAILAGKDISLEALKLVAGNTSALKSVASDSISQAYGLANQARQSETSGAINNFLKYATILGVAGLGAWALVRYSK